MAGKPKGRSFACELKGISTTKKLGESSSTTVEVQISLKASASDVDVNQLIKLQRAGLLECFLEPTQGELPNTGEGD